ncbi:MAG: 50S ribosomal protein L2 [Proteobacteria bacterium]|nr:50S ribosomal protein L2 [Pseudomonadota bacterium]MBU1387731.1 50S ribosomal protein L2 [Pseudomonadota bacterium]MBU1541823.1 50S ribosomal protein L2 [Pseudomonadota bacterium]MBU2431194.1 50S ribosomal protein L2 [Pseudomonadota bacterium]MBU2479778.1 50S ribosomal protein L2 [Pseudomonadota bacterium]
MSTIIKSKPTSPGRRAQEYLSFEEITKTKPERRLTKNINKRAGRNSYGRITAKHRGGGAKKKYRIIDFKRDKDGIPAKVSAIEYDPNRSARIALLVYADGEKRYILAPLEVRVGDILETGPGADIKPGNCLALEDIPTGTRIHNIELKENKGGQIVRSAGAFARLMAKEGTYAQVLLPSGEVRMVHLKCKATVGRVGNEKHGDVKIGKAGRSRWMGRRPSVRGVAMNPVDHPMGGGEGRSSGGRQPCSPWGVLAKGKRTRNSARTDQYIVKRRAKRK